MMSAGFFAIVAVEVALLIVTAGVLLRGRRFGAYESSILIVLLVALIYDNTMLALGATIGEGELLEALSVPRFVTHVFLTPLLLVFAALSADRMGVPSYQKRSTLAFWSGVAVAAVIVGSFIDIIHLDLVPKVDDGILRYTHAEPVPPIAIVMVIIGLIVIGVTMWRKAAWPWVLVGSVAMFAIAAVFPGTGVITNAGEAMLLGAMVATAREVIVRLERVAAVEPVSAL
jgi:hypothetical protein